PASSTSTAAVRISPADAVANLIEKVVPAYPEQGLANHIQNNEVLNIQIDEQGNVADAKVRSGHPAFAGLSLAAVKQWKYRPYLLNGSAVRVETSVLIAYRFSGSKSFPKVLEDLPPSAVSTAQEAPPEDPQSSRFGKMVVDSAQLDSRIINRVEPRYPQMA